MSENVDMPTQTETPGMIYQPREERTDLDRIKLVMRGIMDRFRKKGNPDDALEEIANSKHLTHAFDANPDANNIELQEQEILLGKDFFPIGAQRQIDGILRELNVIIENLSTLREELRADSDKIAMVVKEISEIDRLIRDGELSDYERTCLSFQRMSLDYSLINYRLVLDKNSVRFHDPDLRCAELVEAETRALSLRDECARALGDPQTHISPTRQKEELALLKEQILLENEYVNGDNVMSHVTGYVALRSILENGQLTARSLQARRGTVVSTFAEKGRSEEHQIVFDKSTIRASYARGKDRSDRNREDPIIIMMRARDLMTRYQYVDSDGRHFFGRRHNEALGRCDPFSADATKDNMAILVPKVYRDDLYADMAGIAQKMGVSVETFLKERGVIFIDKEDYTIPSGSVFGGKIFSGTDNNDELDQRIIHHLLEIGKSYLYPTKLSEIEGRVVPTFHLGEGAGGVKERLYTFKVVGEDLTETRETPESYFEKARVTLGRVNMTSWDWEDVISNICWSSEELGHLFTSMVGVREGYRLGQHILMGAGIFERYFSVEHKPISNEFFRTIWLLHDLGKPAAIEHGGAAAVVKQHEYTITKIDDLMERLGFGEREIAIAKAVIDQDFVGNYLRLNLPPAQVVEDMQSKLTEMNLTIGLKDYYQIVKVLYMVDAGSYTKKAGGQAGLDNLFVFDDENGEMRLSSYNNYEEKLQALESLLT